MRMDEAWQLVGAAPRGTVSVFEAGQRKEMEARFVA